jgi:hypothetical protein
MIHAPGRLWLFQLTGEQWRGAEIRHACIGHCCLAGAKTQLAARTCSSSNGAAAAIGVASLINRS